MGLFTGKQQFKAGLHVHTTNSDGSNSLSSVVETHYSRGYDILAITDHSTYANSMTRDWRTSPGGVASARFDVIASGSDRGGRAMLMIPNTIEQSYHEHLNTFFIDYRPTTFIAPADDPHFVSHGRTMEYPGIPEQYTLSNLERTIKEIDDQGGLSHINHPGRYTLAGMSPFPTAPSNDPVQIKKYADLFLAYPSCVGMSIINKKDDESRNDRILWDNINRVTVADPTRPRLVWGLSNDDTHANADTDFSFNVMLMPELTLAAFREAMTSGSFYGVARIARREGVTTNTRESVTPVITDIEVSSTEIRVVAENYDRIEWVAAGTSALPAGEAVNPHEFSDTGPFVRAVVIGAGGVAFTQPIRVRRMRSMAIEILTQVKKPVAPAAAEDVARLGDITAVQTTLQTAINNRAARSGDIGGTDTSSTVQAWRGRSLSTTVPTNNQAYLWTGSLWSPGSVLLLAGNQTMTGNLYIPTTTPTLPNQVINLGYLNQRINEFVTSGGNQFPDAPTSPQYTYGRRYDKTWQQVITPDYAGGLRMSYYPPNYRRGRIALGDSGYGIQLDFDVDDWRGRFYVGGSNDVEFGSNTNFRMRRGGNFRVDARAHFNGFVEINRRGPAWMGNQHQYYQGGGVLLGPNTLFYMGREQTQFSTGPDGWPRARFRVDAMAAFNGRQVWFNGNRTTFKGIAAFGGLVTIGNPARGWRPQDHSGRVRIYQGSFSMDPGGNFRVGSNAEIANYLTIRRRRVPRVWQTGQPVQPGISTNQWNQADWSGGGGIVLDRGTIFNMARQYGSDSGFAGNPTTTRKANFRVDAMASFGTTVWLNGKMYSYGDTTFNHAIWAWGGTFSFTGSNWATVSDARLKQDLEPYERGLADVLKLQPMWYRYSGRRGAPAPGQRRMIGLIAQDVQPIMPEMVGSVRGPIGPTEYLEDHPERIPTEREEPLEETLTLDNSALIYAVVNSLKEVDHRLQVLEAHIALPSTEPPHPEPTRRPGRRR